jgi:hypothetical protein
MQPNKAEVNGLIDPESNDIRFVLHMRVDTDQLTNYNTDRPTFYKQLEYALVTKSKAINGQLRATQVLNSNLNSNELECVVHIIDLGHIKPADVADSLEVAIQTGQIYRDDFFQHTEIFSMEYSDESESNNKVHFGPPQDVNVVPVDQLGGRGSPDSVAAFSLVGVFMGFLLF